MTVSPVSEGKCYYLDVCLLLGVEDRLGTYLCSFFFPNYHKRFPVVTFMFGGSSILLRPALDPTTQSDLRGVFSWFVVTFLLIFLALFSWV